MNKKLEEFLKELTELTNKYDIEIGGCGCCGSPYLYQEIAGKSYNHHDLEFNEKTKKYEVDDQKFEF